MHREQGRGVAGRGQSRPGRRLVLRLESEGRAKRSLEEKQGGSWIEAVQCRDSEERRGACERNVGIVCLLLHCWDERERRSWLIAGNERGEEIWGKPERTKILEWIGTTKLDMNCNDFHFQRKKDILEVCEKCGAAWSGGRARGQLGVGSCRAKWISEWLHQCGNILKRRDEDIRGIVLGLSVGKWLLKLGTDWNGGAERKLKVCWPASHCLVQGRQEREMRHIKWLEAWRWSKIGWLVHYLMLGGFGKAEKRKWLWWIPVEWDKLDI